MKLTSGLNGGRIEIIRVDEELDRFEELKLRM